MSFVQRLLGHPLARGLDEDGPATTDIRKQIVLSKPFPDAERFLLEASRVLVPGGRLLMIEPWVTTWSTFVFSRFHPEPFRPDVAEWQFPSSGPLSGANGAIPWIVFERDTERFRTRCPDLAVRRI